jgi:tetratricopeptide (TPR) repeat protein
MVDPASPIAGVDIRRDAQSLEIFRKVGDRSAVALILNNSAIALRQQGDLAGAKRNYVEALEIRPAIGEKAGVSATLNNLANIVSDEGNLGGAQQMYEESLAIVREIGNKRGTVSPALSPLAFRR